MKPTTQYDEEIAELEREIKRIHAEKIAGLERRLSRLVYLRRSLRLTAANKERMKDPARRAQIGNSLRRRSAKPRPAAVEAYWSKLREIGCIVTGRTDDLTLHHVHSGSIADMGINRGMGQKVSDFLVIPLNRELHCIGPNAIDGSKGVRTWEAENGTQVDLINRLIEKTGVDVWRLSGVTR